MELDPTHFLNAPPMKWWLDIEGDTSAEDAVVPVSFTRWHWRAAYRRGIRPDLIPEYEVQFEEDEDDWHEAVRAENIHRQALLLQRSIDVNGVEDPWRDGRCRAT